MRIGPFERDIVSNALLRFVGFRCFRVHLAVTMKRQLSAKLARPIPNRMRSTCKRNFYRVQDHGVSSLTREPGAWHYECWNWTFLISFGIQLHCTPLHWILIAVPGWLRRGICGHSGVWCFANPRRRS